MRPATSFGLGLRHQHCNSVLTSKPRVDWFEIVSENFLSVGGRVRQVLERVRADYPVAMHGVALSIAGSEPFDKMYLAKLRELARWVQPTAISDHLCWTSHSGVQAYDLLPLAFTNDCLRHVAARVDQVQEALGRRIFLENPSAYVAFAASDMDEADFLSELCRRTGCGVLLDVNNLYVNACNLGVDPLAYLARISPSWLCYMHLAGHSVLPEIRVDTHDTPVPEAVWQLYEKAAQLFPDTPAMVEWDGDVPALEVLIGELDEARRRYDLAVARPPAVTTPKQMSSNIVDLYVPLPLAPSWADLQAAFWRRSINRDRDGLSATPDLLRPDLPSPAAVGIGVYADGYLLRLCEVVTRAFPTLSLVMGAANLDKIVRSYLLAQPPQGLLIRDAAAGFSAYLRSCELPGDFGVTNAVFADIAAFEWAKEDLFDAPNSPAPLAINVLSDIPADDWEHVTFEFVTALRLINTDYAVAATIDAATDPIAEGAERQPPPRPLQMASCYLIARPGIEVVHTELAAPEAAALSALLAGANFATACQVARPHIDTVDPDDDLDEQATLVVVQALGRWFDLGLIHATAVLPACTTVTVPTTRRTSTSLHSL